MSSKVDLFNKLDFKISQSLVKQITLLRHKLVKS